MKKKYLITALTCVFLTITGVFYSCDYSKDQKTLDTITTLSEDSQEEENLDSQENDTINLMNAANNEGKDSENIADLAESSEEEITDTESTATKAADSENMYQDTTSIYVHICGAVINQGVYVTEDSSRIIDVIKLAGGLCEEAAGDYINQAQKVTDGQRIYIPTKEETKELSVEEYREGDTDSSLNEASPVITNHKTELININTADKETLMELPGIGEAKANNIIDYRTTNGNFQSVEDLMNIPGIKEGVFKKFSQYISVN
ncbi:MAG: helix-hairpin-helix domain-containing protein [Mobilitalea sp.]